MPRVCNPCFPKHILAESEGPCPQSAFHLGRPHASLNATHKAQANLGSQDDSHTSWNALSLERQLRRESTSLGLAAFRTVLFKNRVESDEQKVETGGEQVLKFTIGSRGFCTPAQYLQR